MKLRNKIILVIGITLVLTLVFLFVNSSFTGRVVGDSDTLNDAFMKCLKEKEIVMYGFTNSPTVEAQLNLFGKSASKLNVIDCYDTPEKCEGVLFYPSWKIDNKIIYGGLSPGVLSDLSGCDLEK